MNIGFAVYYKDKDGFEMPITEFGIASVFFNESRANKHLEDVKKDLTDLLNPKIEQNTRRPIMHWLYPQIKKEPPVYTLDPVRVELINRQLKTVFVKRVQML